MSFTVALVHANLHVVDQINRELSLHLPHVQKINILDDSILYEATQNGLSPLVLERLVEHYSWCEKMGADVILNTSTILDPAIPICQKFVAKPLMRINEPMCENALMEGHRICILGSLDKAIEAVSSLLMEVSARRGHTLHIMTKNVPDAIEQLDMGDWDMHNRLILEALREIASKCDAVIIAQLSLLPLMPLLKREVDIPVFGSAEPIVARLAEMAHKRMLTPMPKDPTTESRGIDTPEPSNATQHL